MDDYRDVAMAAGPAPAVKSNPVQADGGLLQLIGLSTPLLTLNTEMLLEPKLAT